MKRLRTASSWIWLSFAVVLVGVISAIGSFRAGPPAALDVTSARPNGALAAYQWLQRSGYRVNTETSPSLDLGPLQPRHDNFMILRQSNLSSHQVASLLRWANAGGRIVLAARAGVDNELAAGLGLRTEATSPGFVSVDQPLLLAPPVRELDGMADSVVSGNGSDVSIASVPTGSVLLSRQEGAGRIWILSAPELFENDRIALADNRRLFLNLVGPPGSTVSFDQAGAGTEGSRSPPNWLTGTNWGVAVLFAVVVLFLFRWLSGLRLGPAAMEAPEGHRPAAEYVVSVAGLLRRAHKRTEMLEQYQQSLRRALKQRYGNDAMAWQEVEDREGVERLLAPMRRVSEQDLLRRSAEIVEYEDSLRESRG